VQKLKQNGYSQSINIQSAPGGIPMEVSNISIDAGTIVSIVLVFSLIAIVVNYILQRRKSFDECVNLRIEEKMVPVLNDINNIKEEQKNLNQKQAITAKDVQEIKEDVSKMAVELTYMKEGIEKMPKALATELATVMCNLINK